MFSENVAEQLCGGVEGDIQRANREVQVASPIEERDGHSI